MKVSKADITKSQVSILIEVDGQICLTKMNKDEYDVISTLAKKATVELIKTDVTQDELNRFLLPRWFEE